MIILDFVITLSSTSNKVCFYKNHSEIKGGGTICDEIGPLQKFGFFVLKLSHKVF